MKSLEEIRQAEREAYSKRVRNPDYREKQREANKAYREQHREQRRQSAAKYREKHREELKIKGQAFREANQDDPAYHEKRRAYLSNFRNRHREELNADRRDYYSENREKELARTAEYRSEGEGKAKFKTTHRIQRLRKYGLTIEQFEDLRQKQNNKCAICGDEFIFVQVPAYGNTPTYQKYDCCVDHDHGTGEVRKLLCNRCNKVLGFVKENSTILKNMVEYLGNKL